MPDTMMVIYGRPFDAADDRAIGHGPLTALEALRAAHPELVHDAAPGGGEWWIGREIPVAVEIKLPARYDMVASLRCQLPPVSMENEVLDFCEALPKALRDHPRLLPVATYLIRKRR